APGEHRDAARDGAHGHGRTQAAPGAAGPPGRGPVRRRDRPRAGLVRAVGGWQDLFIEQTLEQYRTLAGRGVPVRLLVGPWSHLDLAAQGAVAINESMAWLDRYAGPGRSASSGRPPSPPDNPVR